MSEDFQRRREQPMSSWAALLIDHGGDPADAELVRFANSERHGNEFFLLTRYVEEKDLSNASFLDFLNLEGAYKQLGNASEIERRSLVLCWAWQVCIRWLVGARSYQPELLANEAAHLDGLGVRGLLEQVRKRAIQLQIPRTLPQRLSDGRHLLSNQFNWRFGATGQISLLGLVPSGLPGDSSSGALGHNEASANSSISSSPYVNGSGSRTT